MEPWHTAVISAKYDASTQGTQVLSSTVIPIIGHYLTWRSVAPSLNELYECRIEHKRNIKLSTAT